MIKNNLKGQIFVVSILITVTVALISAIAILHSIYKETNPDQVLGVYQSAIMDSMADEIKINIFVSQAIKISTIKALDEYLYGNPNPLTNVEGGDPETRYCGSYVYRLWNSVDENCYPDYTSQDFELNTLIDKHLSEIISAPRNDISDEEKYFYNLLTQKIEYYYLYKPDNEYTTLILTSGDNYNINVFKDRKTALDNNIQTYVKSRSAYTGSLIWPTPTSSSVASCFGYRGNIDTASGVKASVYHPGLDISASLNAPVIAAAPGTVEQILYPAWGKIIINHGNGLKTSYMHLNSISPGLGVGSMVEQGQVIGYVGGRGEKLANAYSPHLHFEVISTTVDPNLVYEGIGAVIKNKYVNPMCFINQKSIDGPPLAINFNFDSLACNSICNIDGSGCICSEYKNKCSRPEEDISSSAPYKFCESYENEGIISKKDACLKQDKTDWKIDDVYVSETDLDTDSTLKIFLSIKNDGDSCVSLTPQITIGEVSIKTDKTIIDGESFNVYKSTDALPVTTIEIANCKFTTDKDVATKARQDKECILYAYDDGRKIEYGADIKVVDYNDISENIGGSSELKFVVKKSKTPNKDIDALNSNHNTDQTLLKEFEDVKTKISATGREPLQSGEPVIIVVGTEPQKMYVVREASDGVISIDKTYDVSLAKNGFGNIANSNKTPLGLHVINEKIGDNVPSDTIFVATKPTSEKATIYTDKTNVEKDYVLSRVMWLDGLEPDNKNTHSRYIYIHGTAEEGLIGTAQSHGCIRMKNSDVIELFNLVKSGTYVYIIPKVDNTDNILKDEIYAGILGKYSIEPKFNVKLNFDIRLFDMLTEYATKTVSECGRTGVDKEDCFNKSIDMFNRNLPQEYMNQGIYLKPSCDKTKDEAQINKFVEEVNDCMLSRDDDCRCRFSDSKVNMQSINSMGGSTMLSYYDYELNVVSESYFDYDIVDNGEYLNKEYRSFNRLITNSLMLGEKGLYKNGTHLDMREFGNNNGFCSNVKNTFRACLYTPYTYDKYDAETGNINVTQINIPFAITLRDDVAPLPVTGLQAEIWPHAKNSVLLKWDAGNEQDIVRYVIYLTGEASDFDGRLTEYFKDVMTYRSIDARQTDYIKYKDVDFDDSICVPETSSLGTGKYCIFKYKITDIDGKEYFSEIEKEKLYYIVNQKKFIYIIDGADASNAMSSGSKKAIAVTAVDIDGNEIDNNGDGDKIRLGSNMIEIIPEDRLEPGLVEIKTIEVMDNSVGLLNNKQIRISWNNINSYIDDSKIDYTDITYKVHVGRGSCNDGDLKSVDILADATGGPYSTNEASIDIAVNSNDYCVGVSSIKDNLEYDLALVKHVTAPSSTNPDFNPNILS